jgi:hypothetical protein
MRARSVGVPLVVVDPLLLSLSLSLAWCEKAARKATVERRIEVYLPADTSMKKTNLSQSPWAWGLPATIANVMGRAACSRIRVRAVLPEIDG